MIIIKVGIDKYIHVDRITYVEPVRKGRALVHFAVGGGDVAGPSCQMKLEQDETEVLRRWLDAHCEGCPS